MIALTVRKWIEDLLAVEAAVAFLGPRQVSKTTLSRIIGDTRESVHRTLGIAVLAASRSRP